MPDRPVSSTIAFVNIARPAFPEQYAAQPSSGR